MQALWEVFAGREVLSKNNQKAEWSSLQDD
jgi:hypothetical protein